LLDAQLHPVHSNYVLIAHLWLAELNAVECRRWNAKAASAAVRSPEVWCDLQSLGILLLTHYEQRRPTPDV